MQEYSIVEIIELAIQIEKNGYEFYNNALNVKKLSQNAKNILTTLRDEELAHEESFKNLRSIENLNSITNDQNWGAVSYFLNTIAESHVFSKKNNPKQLLKNIKNEKEIIELAIQFEKDTLLFFYSLQDEITDEKTLKIIHLIVQEEVKHIMKLKKYLV